MQELPNNLQQLQMVAQLALSALLGSVLGLERELRGYPAGLRTHMLVSLGAAAFTIAGIHGVAAFGTVQDAGRVAAQIVTGIGFIGAGTIWRSSVKEGVIRGLTTAASIWVAASIGMLCGFGLYVLAGGCAVIGFTVLRLLKDVERMQPMLGRAVARRLRRERRTTAPAEQAIATGQQPARDASLAEAPGALPHAPGRARGETGISAGPAPQLPLRVGAPLTRKRRRLRRLRQTSLTKEGREEEVDQLERISDQPRHDRNDG
jgi:putative Mg2+ transporter-C (MgtC) family protein